MPIVAVQGTSVPVGTFAAVAVAAVPVLGTSVAAYTYLAAAYTYLVVDPDTSAAAVDMHPVGIGTFPAADTSAAAVGTFVVVDKSAAEGNRTFPVVEPFRAVGTSEAAAGTSVV